MDTKPKLPDAVLEIFSMIEEYGAKAYAVGGCVRDSIMGREPQDLKKMPYEFCVQ